MNTISSHYYSANAPASYYPLFVLASLALLLWFYNAYQQHKRSQKRIELTNKFTPATENESAEEKPQEQTKKVSSGDLAVRRIFDNTTGVLWFISLTGDIKYISKSVKDFLGYEADELIDNRAITIFAKSDYNRFETMCKRLYQDINILENRFSFKTKGGLLKNGDCIIKPYSDMYYGEGYIGSVHPVSADKIKQKVQGEQEFQALVAERDSLKLRNQELSADKADLVEKINLILKEQEELQLINPLDFAEFNAERILMQRHYLSRPTQDLKLGANKIIKLLNDKRMAKYDLIEFCQAVKNNALKSKRLDAFFKSEQALILRLITDYSAQNESHAIKQTVAETLTPLGTLFSESKHIINLHIADNLTADIDILALSELLIYLVTMSLSLHFANEVKGEIDISFKQNDGNLEFTYSDNGTLNTPELQHAFYASFLGKSDFPLLNNFSKKCLGATSISISESPNFVLKLSGF